MDSILPGRDQSKLLNSLFCSYTVRHECCLPLVFPCPDQWETRLQQYNVSDATERKSQWLLVHTLCNHSPWKIKTRVLIRSGPKPYAANPHPQWCSRWNLMTIGQLVSEIFMFESVDARMDAQTHGRRLESHTISSPRAFGYGELKMFVCLIWFDSYIPVNNYSVMSGWVFLGLTSPKQGLNVCLLYLISNSMFKTTSDSFSHSLKVWSTCFSVEMKSFFNIQLYCKLKIWKMI